MTDMRKQEEAGEGKKSVNINSRYSVHHGVSHTDTNDILIQHTSHLGNIFTLSHFSSQRNIRYFARTEQSILVDISVSAEVVVYISVLNYVLSQY